MLNIRLTRFNKLLFLSFQVTVAAKVIEMAEVEIQHTSSGKSLKKRDIIIADKTGSINLTIWEGAINEIALGKCYKMKNLTIRIWNEKKTLSSSLNSSVEEINNFGPVVKSNDYQTLKKERVQINIISASATKFKTCAICNVELKDLNMDLKTFKCTNCNMRQNLKSVRETLRCEIVARQQEENKQVKYVVTNQALNSFEATKDIDDPDQMEDALLSFPNVFVVLSGLSINNIYLETNEDVDEDDEDTE